MLRHLSIRITIHPLESHHGETILLRIAMSRMICMFALSVLQPCNTVWVTGFVYPE